VVKAVCCPFSALLETSPRRMCTREVLWHKRRGLPVENAVTLRSYQIVLQELHAVICNQPTVGSNVSPDDNFFPMPGVELLPEPQERKNRKEQNGKPPAQSLVAVFNYPRASCR
jgi:hypothetical protein